jgi:hypothetical protein
MYIPKGVKLSAVNARLCYQRGFPQDCIEVNSPHLTMTEEGNPHSATCLTSNSLLKNSVWCNFCKRHPFHKRSWRKWNGVGLQCAMP